MRARLCCLCAWVYCSCPPLPGTQSGFLSVCLGSQNDFCPYRLPGRRKAMKGRLYFTTKAQKEGKIMIKTHPCARIFCCRFCGFDEVGGAGRAAGSTPAP